MKSFKLWQTTALMPLEVQGPVLPFWNPPVNISLDLDCQLCSSSFSLKKPCWKMLFYLISHYTHSVTNEHHCITFFGSNFRARILTTCSLRPFTIENAKKIQNFDIFTKIWHRSWFGRIFQYIRCHPKLLIRFENSNWEYKDILYIILMLRISRF